MTQPPTPSDKVRATHKEGQQIENTIKSIIKLFELNGTDPNLQFSAMVVMMLDLFHQNGHTPKELIKHFTAAVNQYTKRL